MKKIILGVLVAGAGCSLWADSTIDPAHPYAYGANVGWINTIAETNHGAVIGLSYCTGFLYSANAGWIGLGNGPTNGWRYSNVSADDWGVNHDGAGRLIGYAYGANIGWINFEQTYGQPRVDLRTGHLSGYAYGANVGWIGLSNAMAFVRVARLNTGPDTDFDNLPDTWEYRHTNTLTVLQVFPADRDGDGVPDEREYLADTDPMNPDDFLAVTDLDRQGATNILSWTARPTRLYQVEKAAAVTGEWVDAVGSLVGPPASSPASAGVTDALGQAQSYRTIAVVPLGE